MKNFKICIIAVMLSGFCQMTMAETNQTKSNSSSASTTTTPQDPAASSAVENHAKMNIDSASHVMSSHKKIHNKKIAKMHKKAKLPKADLPKTE